MVRGAGIDAHTTQSPQIARRALSVSPGGHVHRPAPIAMRPLRQKSSRFLNRGALEASQSRGLVSRLTGASARLLNGAQRDCVLRRCCRRHATSIRSVTVAPGRIRAQIETSAYWVHVRLDRPHPIHQANVSAPCRIRCLSLPAGLRDRPQCAVGYSRQGDSSCRS